MRTRWLFLFFITLLQFGHSQIALPQIFGNDMVLQRESTVFLYGWAAPNETFTITTGWDGEVIEVKTGINAKWKLAVETPKAGGPYALTFKGSANTITLNNVMLGEVWLCSGQSNMEWSANSGIDNKANEIAAASHPNIRFFSVAKRTSSSPQEDVSGIWESCTPETMASFSAVAYFFGKRIQEVVDVPIGLIDASWGASCAEVWTPEFVFDEQPELIAAHERIQPNKWVTTERSLLYNAMIAPLTDFTIAGVLWYQGESNTANGETYTQLFTSMIRAWRSEWNKDFPFYFAQIAPYKYGKPFEGAVVRDQQRQSLSLKNTGMVVTSDICTTDDIHPQNKQDVGLRLANIALKEQYMAHVDEVYGPLFDRFEVQKNKILLYFDHANGLYLKPSKEEYFEIAGADGIYHTAKAKIKNDVVQLTAKEVNVPVFVRFAWQNTAMPNLYNGAQLPASAFRSN